MPLTSNQIIDLYDAQSEMLLKYLTRRTLDAQIAMDIVGETFAVAYEKRRRFRGDPSVDGPGWMYGIAKNLLRDYFRSGSAERKAMNRLGVAGVDVLDEDILRIEQLAGNEQLRAAVAAAIEELKPDQQHALRLRIVDELSYPEVAQQMQVSEQVARARVSRGLGSLRGRLSPQILNEVTENV